MKVDFKGIGETAATFLIDSSETSLKPGMPVSVTDNGTVKKCPSNEAFAGVCVGVRDGFAAVLLAGYCEVETSGTISLGCKQLAGDGTGKVKAGSSGPFRTVVSVSSGSAGIFL